MAVSGSVHIVAWEDTFFSHNASEGQARHAFQRQARRAGPPPLLAAAALNKKWTHCREGTAGEHGPRLNEPCS